MPRGEPLSGAPGQVHALVDLVAQIAAVDAVTLVGSRAEGGEPTPLSDWDFEVRTSGFEDAAVGIIRAAAHLDPAPLAVFFDPLGTRPNLTVLLDGPVKVDLIFPDVPFEPAEPWEVSAATLPKVDAHFWDWILWLAAKQTRGLDDVVEFSLEDVHRFVLVPMGDTAAPPTTLPDAIERYEALRRVRTQELGVHIDPTLGHQVHTAVSSES